MTAEELEAAREAFVVLWDELVKARSRYDIPAQQRVDALVPYDIVLALNSLEHDQVREIDGVLVQRGPYDTGGFRVLSSPAEARCRWEKHDHPNGWGVIDGIGYYRVAGRILAARLGRGERAA